MLAGCRREVAPEAAVDGRSDNERLAELVRSRYTAPDVEAAGAWVWTGPDSVHFVLVDVQSAIQGVVQGRAELWMASDSDAALFGRSEVLPSVAQIGAYAFEDLSGDGVPDLFGFVSDSSGVTYPVFIPGSRPGMTEEITLAAAGWRFSVEEEYQPRTHAPGGVVCAIQLWAEEPAPDGAAPGWRWLALQRDGRLAPPTGVPPTCAGDGVGVQPVPARP